MLRSKGDAPGVYGICYLATICWYYLGTIWRDVLTYSLLDLQCMVGAVMDIMVTYLGTILYGY